MQHTRRFTKTLIVAAALTLAAAWIPFPEQQCYASDESLSVFKLGERFFSDSLHNLALEQYQKYLNLKRRGPEYDPVAYYKVALCYHAMDNSREAAKAFEEYIRLFPSESNIMDAMFMAGASRKAIGDYKEASDWYHSVWSRFVGSSKARFALYEAAVCAQMDEKPERAIELYTLFYSRFPDNEKAKHVALSLAHLYIGQKDYPQASEILKDVSRKWKSDKVFTVRVLFYQALLQQRMHKPKDASEFYAKMDKYSDVDFPEKTSALKNRIELLADSEAHEEALGVFKRLFALYSQQGNTPRHSFVWSWAETARKAREFDAAIALYQQLLDTYPDKVDKSLVQYRLAECLVGKEDFARAIEALQNLESAGRNDEYSARAVLKIGDLYFSRNLYPSAIAAYRRYLQIPDREDNDRVLYRIGKVYQDKYERNGAALREFENLLKWYPSSPYHSRTVIAIAECYEAAGEYQSAIRQYEFLIETGADKNLVEKADQRVQYLRTFRIKDSETAVHKLTELLEKDPDTVTPLERLRLTARIYQDYLKDYTKALASYESVLALDSPLSDTEKAEMLYGQAQVYQRLHEKAVYENDLKTASYMRDKAVELYKNVLESYPEAQSADDAAYGILMLAEPNIAEYEKFLSDYPKSKYLPEVLLRIASHYESRAAEAGDKLSVKAAEFYQKIVAQFPAGVHAPRASLGLARSFLTLGQLDSATSVLDTFNVRYAAQHDDPEAYYMRGVVAKRRKDYEEAAEELRQVLYRYPFSPYAARARFELGFSELENGQVFEALNNFRFYEQNYPNGERLLEIQYGIARCLLMMDKADEAKAMFVELLDSDLPSKMVADIQYSLALLAEDAKDTYSAMNHYKEALDYEGFTKRGTVFEKLGNLYFESRIYPEAAQAFAKSLPHALTREDSIRIMTRAISAGIMSDEGKKVDKRIKSFKERFPDEKESLSEIVYYEGAHFFVEKAYEKAINRFKYILAKYDGTARYDDAAYQIALCHLYSGKEDEALRQLYEFPTLYPQSPFVPSTHFKVGMVLHGRDEFVQAAEYFKKVIEHEKADPKTRFRAAYNAAVAYQKISSWDDAATMYKIVMTEFPEEVPASSLHLKIGFCLIQGSRVEEALGHFKKAQVNPKEEDKPEILYWIGTCYARLGEYQKAITEYLKVPYLYAGMGKWGVTAELESARLYERLNEYSKAITLYNKIVRSDGEQGRFGRQAKERIQRLNTIMAETP